MLKRILPVGYGRPAGRLVAYSVGWDEVRDTGRSVWAFRLDKSYLPWDAWERVWRDGLDKYGAETRALDEILDRLRAERPESTEILDLTTFTRVFPAFAAAGERIFEEEILPLVRDELDYHWPAIKGMLIEMLRAEGVDYAAASEPEYLADRFDEVASVWDVVRCIAHVNGAKWELGRGFCGNDPDPTDFHYPRANKELEIGGWFKHWFGDVGEPTVDQLVQSWQQVFPVRDSFRTIQQLANIYGPRAAELAFGQVWEEKWGYEALLTDLEGALAGWQELLALNWCWNLRVAAR